MNEGSPMIWRFTLMTVVLATSISADTLRMRDGSVVNGSFLGGTSYDIRFLVNDEVRHFARAHVAEIVFGSDSALASPSPDSRRPAAGAPRVDPGPDYAGAPFLRGSNGYIPLEREVGMMMRGGGMYGMGGVVYRVQGQRSPVRVRQGDRIVFVVRLSAGGDPRQFQLFRLEPRMGYRQTPPGMGGGPTPLPTTINQVGDSVWEIIPVRVLYPGEYAVSPTNSNESYCFGVDY
jgi:hypothetical protein